MSQVVAGQASTDTHLTTQLTRASWGKLAMWLFLTSDAMTFGGLLVGYAVLRADNTDWPLPSDHLAFTLGVVMTALLLGSSVTMMKAHAAAKNASSQQFRFCMLVTVAAGVLFLALQGYEWRHLHQAGMTLTSNPWGAPLFGATFYTLTGFHGLHVLAGIVYLSLILLGGIRKTDLSEHHGYVEIAGLYWHFVDIVWIFVFACVYLL